MPSLKKKRVETYTVKLYLFIQVMILRRRLPRRHQLVLCILHPRHQATELPVELLLELHVLVRALLSLGAGRRHADRLGDGLGDMGRGDCAATVSVGLGGGGGVDGVGDGDSVQVDATLRYLLGGMQSVGLNRLLLQRKCITILRQTVLHNPINKFLV